MREFKKEEIKNILEEAKKENKIIVEVLQNNKTVNFWEDEKNNISQLLGFLYTITVLKSKNYKIKYIYNYSDVQTITVINTNYNYDDTKTITKYVFYNVPTGLGFLDTYKITKKLESKEA